MNNWTYDEFEHCGVDYSNKSTADQYDNDHEEFRNYEQEAKDLLQKLSLKNSKDMSLIDLGCGTGAISIAISKHFKQLFAVDISDEMLLIAKKKAKDQGIDNISFINSGFLTYEHKEAPADIVISKAALHHLPDFWKQIALMKINKMLKMNGRFYLFDIAYHFAPQEYEETINSWIQKFESIAGGSFKKEVETHIRDEFSTFSWIIEKMLKEAGFSIDQVISPDKMQTEYFCTKIKEI